MQYTKLNSFLRQYYYILKNMYIELDTWWVLNLICKKIPSNGFVLACPSFNQ